ncbi:outer membrane lipoprotein carrier protein LolA [Pendulispora albinea]|uniref:Outer membrane lipoprotein carrier protein LolA n=1 Tax=Pendulispora albinea TaxID=2741071 RepID=A0ABZ2M2H0_9BACT
MRHLHHLALATILAALSGFTAVSHAQPAGQPAQPVAAAAQPTPPAAAVPSVDQAVGKVQGFYEKTTSFKANFNQEYFVKAYNQRKSSRGKVTFAKPGKMDWVYDEPKDQRIVSDGSILRVYEGANKQMYEQPVDKAQYSAALSFLTGQGKLTDHFNFEIAGGEKMAFPGGYVLIGVPKQPQAAYTKVFFYVDAATSQVRRVMVLDGQGNRNKFDFENPRVNEPVTAEQFKFVPPHGTTIVHP